MVIEISSDSSSGSSGNPESERLLDELLQQWNIRPTRATPLDFVLPPDSRLTIPFDPRHQPKQMEVGEQANAPEEVPVRGRARRPCRFSHYLNGDPEEYRSFCETYEIPADVVVRAGPSRREEVEYREGELTLPLMAIIEGGVRFPLDPFLRQFLRALTLTTSQITVNTYRVICSIANMRRRESLLFGLAELFCAYKISRSGNPPRYYLSSRPEFLSLLVDGLPDSDEWADTYVCVFGNFMFGRGEAHDTPVQWTEGVPGLSPALLFCCFFCLQLPSYLLS